MNRNLGRLGVCVAGLLVVFGVSGCSYLEDLLRAGGTCWDGGAYVPNVVGLRQAQAERRICLARRVELGEVTQAYSDDVAEGVVISQSISGFVLYGGCGDDVVLFRTVDLVVSLGPEPVAEAQGKGLT